MTTAEDNMTETTDSISRERERALVSRVRAGDAAATRELIDSHKDRLFAFIWRIIRNHHDAEEVCQEAFLKAFASLESFSTDFRFSTWLFTIAYRVCLNQMRRKKALTGELDFESMDREAEGPERMVAESEEAQQLRTLVWSAVDELSGPQKAAVMLFYRHDQSCHDIAQVLQLPVATVKSHLHRARAKLRDVLATRLAADSHGLRNFRLARG